MEYDEGMVTCSALNRVVRPDTCHTLNRTETYFECVAGHWRLCWVEYVAGAKSS